MGVWSPQDWSDDVEGARDEDVPHDVANREQHDARHNRQKDILVSGEVRGLLDCVPH